MSAIIDQNDLKISEKKATQASPRLLLIGNPNVGKSVIFSYLTGRYVTVSNYPGTTVEVSHGKMRYGGVDWEVVDSPGVNSLAPHSEDERVTRDILLEAPPDVIVQVADAKNLRRTLLITSQLAEFGLPMVLVLNMMDEARSRGIEIDVNGISELFGIPVLKAVATEGEGLYDLFKNICKAKIPTDPLNEPRERLLAGEGYENPGHTSLPLQNTFEWMQTQDANLREPVENYLEKSGVEDEIFKPESRLRLRKLSSRLDQLRNGFLEQSVAKYKKTIPTVVDELRSGVVLKLVFILLALGTLTFLYTEIGRAFGLPTPYSLLTTWLDGHALPRLIASLDGLRLGWLGRLLFGTFNSESGAFENGLLYPAVTQFALLIAPVVIPLMMVLRRSRLFGERLGYWSRDWKTGVPMLLVVLLLMYEFVGVIGAASLVDALENTIFNTFLTPGLQAIIPPGLIYDFLLGTYGLISVGMTYALAIVLPIVATFFIAFGLLEDSGYLPRLAILSDRVFRVIGLNGKAILPMVLGLGCDTMATMTTRILGTKKERLIATMLLALGVPCSAQLGVILAISGSMSLGAVTTVVGVILSQMLLVGYLSSKIIKGKRSDFIFELPPIRIPILKNVWTKTRYRMVWYLREALPLFLLGTLILFLLDKLRMNGRSGLDFINSAFSPIVTGVLKLPERSSQVFILGFLRRDYGAAGLFDMVRNGLMDSVQIVTSLIVLTLFIPCVANFFMIIREQGTKRAMLILAFITPFAIAVGAVVNFLLRYFGITF
ncbi:MAG: ferrous iron transporter B [Acidobacteria bacterium]|nr:ferrous iron transporter B [Acidobacteriota bacterium]